MSDPRSPGGSVELEAKYRFPQNGPDLPWQELQRLLCARLTAAGYAVRPADPAENSGGLSAPVTQTDQYFDTEEGALHRAGCSLRVRTAQDRAELTCKRPAGAGPQGARMERYEFSVPLPAPGLFDCGESRSFAARYLAGLVQFEALRPAVTIVNHRARYLVEAGGEIYELAFDDVTYTAPASRRTCSEKQVELELKSPPPPRLMRSLTGHLEAALAPLGLIPMTQSKYERARSLTQQAPDEL